MLLLSAYGGGEDDDGNRRWVMGIPSAFLFDGHSTTPYSLCGFIFLSRLINPKQQKKKASIIIGSGEVVGVSQSKDS